jgi:hypothetical protein
MTYYLLLFFGNKVRTPHFSYDDAQVLRSCSSQVRFPRSSCVVQPFSRSSCAVQPWQLLIQLQCRLVTRRAALIVIRMACACTYHLYMCMHIPLSRVLSSHLHTRDSYWHEILLVWTINKNAHYNTLSRVSVISQLLIAQPSYEPTLDNEAWLMNSW